MAARSNEGSSVELPKRKQNRLTEYNYAMPNAYFITICAEHRKNLFWTHTPTVLNHPKNVPLSACGDAVYRGICAVPVRYPMISVDNYAIMPNHVHLLLQIHSDADGRQMAAPTISTVVNQMKGAVSKEVGRSIWQKGFYDHVIRGEGDYREIWQYIEGNPGKWMEDTLFQGDTP